MLTRPVWLTFLCSSTFFVVFHHFRSPSQDILFIIIQVSDKVKRSSSHFNQNNAQIQKTRDISSRNTIHHTCWTHIIWYCDGPAWLSVWRKVQTCIWPSWCLSGVLVILTKHCQLISIKMITYDNALCHRDDDVVVNITTRHVVSTMARWKPHRQHEDIVFLYL